MSEPPKRVCEVGQACYILALDMPEADSLFRRWQTCTDDQALEMLGVCVFTTPDEARANRDRRITGPWRIYEYQSREIK
jgi:hypothetical protein